MKCNELKKIDIWGYETNNNKEGSGPFSTWLMPMTGWLIISLGREGHIGGKNSGYRENCSSNVSGCAHKGVYRLER